MSRALKRIFHVEDQLPHLGAYPSAARETNVSQASTLPSQEEENCVVQCPSCFTRFSLPFASLAGQSDPRFHCSQCDTIFRAEAENSPSHTQITIPEPPYTDFSEPHYEFNQTTAHNEVVDTLVAASLDESESPQVFGATRRESQGLGLESENSSNAAAEIYHSNHQRHEAWQSDGWNAAPAPSKSFEIPRSVESSWSLGPPHESAAHQSEAPAHTFKLPSESLTRAEEPSQMSLGLNINPLPVDAEPLSNHAWERSVNTASSSTNSASSRVTSSAPPDNAQFNTFPKQGVPSKSPKSFQRNNNPNNNGEVAIKRRQLLLSFVPKISFNIPLGRWRAPLVIAGPLLSFCLALFLVSVVLKTNPLQSEEMITSAIPGITRVAPPGLAVIEARIRKIVLDSGESLYALSGRVKNNSGKVIKRITLDGLVFDKQGMLLGEKQVLVSSPLAQSKIKSLSIDMIEDIEANASKGKTSVKDGESAPFVVTFRPQEVAGARYFSTRINSIK